MTKAEFLKVWAHNPDDKEDVVLVNEMICIDGMSKRSIRRRILAQQRQLTAMLSDLETVDNWEEK